MLNIHKNQNALTIDEILNYYDVNCKNECDYKIGLEYEQLSVDSKTFKTAQYESIKKIIEHFVAIKNWGILKDDNVTIGALGSKSSISLEPGCQFEISLEPKKELFEIEKEMHENITLLNSIAKAYGVKFLQYGVSPLSTYQNIDIVPKNRYLIMADYFKKDGACYAPVMMRETAGVQVNFDYKNSADALKKLKACALMSPFLTGLFANSPIRAGKLTNYKSFRALAWLYTDSKRCNLFYKNLIDNKSNVGFQDYAENILSLPMLFIERNDRKIEINGKINFRTFMKEGFKGFVPELHDYILHSSLSFPDVRLKNCLEIRNHDSQNLPLALSICAFYKCILYGNAIDKVFEILDFNHSKLSDFAHKSAKFGLSYEINGKSAFEFAEKLFEISFENAKENEKKYFEIPFEMLRNRQCPSDLILKNHIKNVEDLANFL